MTKANIYDIVIIGSGPAGIQSVLSLQGYGLKIALLDDTSSLGGQIYKNVEKNSKNKKLFKEEYLKGLDYIKRVNLDEITYINNATVWNIGADLEIYYSKEGTSHEIFAKKIVLATGSMERAVPVKGWTLPGIIGVTAAQIILKESSIIKNDAVFVGSGPLFYYVISQYLDVGAKIKAVIDTTPLNNYFKSFKYLPRALMDIVPLIKGLGFFLKFKKHNLKVYNFAKEVKFQGNEELQSVSFKKGSKDIKIDAKIAFIHNGLAPNINLQLQAGCDYEFSYKTRTVNIKTDEYMQSSVKNIFVIGDGKSIRGVDVAMVEAKIASIKILKDFDKIKKSDFNTKFDSCLKELKSCLHIRDFLDALYLPDENMIYPSNDDVVVCRCEEVTLGDIKESLKTDCRGPNSVKSFTRCGMGNCQGRFCGLTLLEIISKETNVSIEKLKYLRIRSPIKPVRIEEMGKLASHV